MCASIEAKIKKVFRLKVFCLGEANQMKFKETQIITLANQKGGCGKTTSSISIAAAFHKLGYSVALLDLDPQCNTTEHFGISPDDLYAQNKLTILDALVQKRAASDILFGFDKERFDDRFFIIPGNKQLGEVGSYLEIEAMQKTRFNRAEIDQDEIRDEHRQRLSNSLKSVRGKFDVVIVDTPPNLGFLMTSGLVASDWFIIPVFPSKYDLSGLEELTVAIAKIRERYNPELKFAGVLLGNFDKSTKLDRQIGEYLEKKFGENAVFKTSIARGVKMRELTFAQKTVFEFSEAAQQAEQFESLVKEMINRASKGVNTTAPIPELSEVAKRVEETQIPIDSVVNFEDSREVANG